MSLHRYWVAHTSLFLKKAPSRLSSLDCSALASDVIGNVSTCLLVLLYFCLLKMEVSLGGITLYLTGFIVVYVLPMFV